MDIERIIANIYYLHATIPPEWLANPNLKWQLNKETLEAFLRHYGSDPESIILPKITLLGIAVQIIESDQISLVMEVK